MCMNALEIPLTDGSVDTVVANSVLHLISNPEKVVSEIYRVLKIGGKFICIDDAPGQKRDNDFDNTKYYEIVNYIYGEYWNKLGDHQIRPKKYSWKFNREAVCDKIFKGKDTRIIECGDVY